MSVVSVTLVLSPTRGERRREVIVVRPRWRKVYRDLLAHKFRTLLVVLSIAVGIFAVGVMMGGRAVLIRSLDTGFPQTRPPDVSFALTPFDEHLVKEVERDSEVGAAQGRRSVAISYRVNGAEWKNITLYAYKDYSDIEVGRLTRLGTTQWPRRGQLVVEKGSVEFSGLSPGDTVEFDTSEHKHPILTVSGTIHDLNSVVPMMSGRAVGYVSWDDLPDLQEAQAFNSLEVRARGKLDTLAQALELGSRLRDDVIERQGFTVLRMSAHEPGVQNIGNIFKGVSMLLVLVGAMTLALSGFLVINTIGALVSQQTRQLGVMKSVGARSSQLVGMFVAMVVSYGVLALVISLPLGQLGSNWFADFGASKLDFRVLDYTTPRTVLAIELAVGLLVPLLAASVPVFLGMRMPVRHALYGSGVGSAEFGESFIDRALGMLRGLPRPVALALRNTFLRKGRLALTLAALTLAAGVFMAVASVKASIDYTVAKFGQHRVMDIWADVYPPQPATDAEAEAKRVQGVVGAEGWMLRSAIRERPDRTESNVLFLYGLPPTTKYLQPEIVSGRWLRTGDTNDIVIDDSFLKDNKDVVVGSTVTLKIRNVEQAFRVVGISRGDLLNEFGYVSKEYLDNRLAAHGAIDTLMIGTSQHDEEFQTQAAQRLSEDFSARQMRVTDSMTQTELQKTIRDSLNILVVFLGILAGLLAAVGGIGLSGTMSINVLESTREIGVMRAVGASNRSIYQIFITEGVVVGLVSWALGVVISFPITLILLTSLGESMSFPLSTAYSPLGIVAWLVFVIVISVLASLLPAYRAARVSVAEAIAYE
jgi:putative ABC transport system permease protein